MKKFLNKQTRRLFGFSIAITCLLTVLIPQHGSGIKSNILYYGFPEPFLTVYTQEFFLQFKSHLSEQPIPFFNRFSIDLLPFIIDVIIIWLVLIISCKLALKLWQTARHFFSIE